MRFGLGLNANEELSATVQKATIAEASGLDYVWVTDPPLQFNAPVVASAIASTTRHIRIGVGLVSVLLHSPRLIASSVAALCEAYGNRFDICIGVGDRLQLRHGHIDVENIHDLPQRMLAARREISSQLHDSGVTANTWIGAQGPRMLQLANSFNGVLMNYSKQEMIAEAIKQIGPLSTVTDLGIYAPSYVYINPNSNLLHLTKVSSTIVAVGAASGVLKSFSLYERFIEARRMAENSPNIKRIVASVPDDVVNLFSITMPAARLYSYLTELKSLGVSTVIFGYPQSHSIGAVQELTEALSNFTDSSSSTREA